MGPPSGTHDEALMANNQNDDKLHIAMFPWLAFGHILPYLELAKLFAQKGHKILFVSTPRNIQRLPKLPPNLSSSINLVKLPLPSSEFNLPNDAESTSDLTREKVPLLKKAYDALRDSLSDLLQSSKPDWLLYDFAAYWVPEMARNIGLRIAYFSIVNAACLAYAGAELQPDYRTEPDDFIVPPKWVPFPSTVAYRKFEVLRVFNDLTGLDDDVSVCHRLVQSLRGCHVVALRSSRELEPEYLHLLGDLSGKPVFPIGQLPPIPYEDKENDGWRSTKEWLDLQPKRSVVYIAFGSEVIPSQDELTELALGLELSGFPFYWVLKSHTGSAELPTGFEDRTRGRGIVCTSWAPQLKILAHDSVGGFLTHSGWSSVVEALQFGIPLVLLTYTNDQGLNARLLEEKMLGYSIPRDENDGSFSRESVAESVKLVVEKEEGKVYRDKAKEMSPVFGDRGLQNKYVDEFLGFLKDYTRSKDEDTHSVGN